MAEFTEKFMKLVSAIGDFIKNSDDLQEMFAGYQGRSLTISIVGDATYVFDITKNGIIFKGENLKNPPRDMGLKIDIETARRIITTGCLSTFDLPSMKFKNIDMADVNLVVSLFANLTDEQCTPESTPPNDRAQEVH